VTVALNLWNAAATVLWYLLLRRHLRNVVDKQSVEVIAAFFVAGILSVVLTFTLHALNPLPWLAPFVYNVTFLYEVLVTGVVEETAKFLCFLLIAHSLTTVREPQDGVLQGAAVGLGFAFIENIVYFDRFSDLALAVRPIISTGGHMIYGAVWGGLYSAARWSNIRDKDPGAYRVALLGVAATALIHGTYNSIVIYGWLIGAVVDGIILPVVFVLFVYLEERSPYRTFPLSQAQWAVPALERGLAFNRTSPILNTRMGLYLMRLGLYRRAAEHFSRAMPRSADRDKVRFFQRVCEFTFVPEFHAQGGLRDAWGRLSDPQRQKVSVQLEQLLANDLEQLYAVQHFLNSAFTRRRGKQGYELALELKHRKVARRRASAS